MVFISNFLSEGGKVGYLNVSHLLFVGDTLLFCDASHDCICASRALLCFKFVSTLKVNLGKSDVVLVGHNADSMASILGCKISHLPMKFLGLL